MTGAIATTLLTTTSAAKLLGVSSDLIRKLERAGVLPARKTASGVRLFDPEALIAAYISRRVRRGHR